MTDKAAKENITRLTLRLPTSLYIIIKERAERRAGKVCINQWIVESLLTAYRNGLE